jgi:hypothetical protein
MQHRVLLRLTLALVLPFVGAALASAEPPNPADYQNFGREVAQVVSNMKEVAKGSREQADLRGLEFLLRDYNAAVAAKNWRQADRVKAKMRVYLVRGRAVAADAKKRKADQARADAERRHREQMRQKERQHREAMLKQQRLLEQLWLNQLQNGGYQSGPYWQ